MAQRRLIKRGGKPPPLTAEEEDALRWALRRRPLGLSAWATDRLRWLDGLSPERRVALAAWWRLPARVRAATPCPEAPPAPYPMDR